MTTADPDPLDAPTAALAAAVLEVARHVEGGRMPAPRLFALARSTELLAVSPALASLLGGDQDETPAPDELDLTPIDLGAEEAEADASDASPIADPLTALRDVQWPDLAAGGALACDLAPDAWAVRDGRTRSDLPPDGALRVVVAALSDGTTWSALRRDDQEGYVLGAALVPDLADALVQTLQSPA